MNKHINKMNQDELVAALDYCKRVAKDKNAPMQLRDEARDLAIFIAFRLRELKDGAK